MIRPSAAKRPGPGGSSPPGPGLAAGRASSAFIVTAVDAVELTALHAALLETTSRCRTGKGRFGRASRQGPCGRERRVGLASPAPRTGNPLRRLLIGSKAVLFLEVLHLVHGTPPASRAGAQRQHSLKMDGKSAAWMTAGGLDQEALSNSAGSSRWVTARSVSVWQPWSSPVPSSCSSTTA